MIREANIKDLVHISEMMIDLYKELMPDHYSKDIKVYMTAVLEHLQNKKDTVYVADHGFFIVRDETEPMAPTMKRFNGIRVYIQPEHRHTSLLARFYDRLFKDFPEGHIMGITEINSEHIKVLDKRHELVAKVYRLNRRK